jgi:twinkle protein
MKTWADVGIFLPSGTGPELYTTCPQCSASRKKKTAKCLSVNIEKNVWLCGHCDWRGSLKSGEEHAGRRLPRRPDWRAPDGVDARLADWFHPRGISRLTLHREQIAMVEQYMPQCEDRVWCMAFPYSRGGEVVNVKYRAVDSKAFRQVADAEKILYRQDAITAPRVYIVEGEIDALSLVQIGITSVVSVPDGAPPADAKNYTSKFTYLDQASDPFAGIETIVLAVDADKPGQALQHELARRLGADRCWYVTWPDGVKDANQLLVEQGAEALRAVLEAAQPFPVQDVVAVTDVTEAVMHRYYHGEEQGLSTGWVSVDKCYTIEAGELTVVTGVPGHGKSEWLDALALNVAMQHGWQFAICSPENDPVAYHVEKLLEKKVGFPFRVGPSARMTPAEVAHGLQWLEERVTFIMPTDRLAIPQVLERATVLVRRRGIRGLIIDPFNEFDHTRPRGQTETEYIGLTLSLLKQWARKWQVHVWLVAHPQKLYRREDGSYPVPTPWDINGSANFRNKADNCLTVWRDESDEKGETHVQIHVQKIRRKHLGKLGLAELAWDRLTGRYRDVLPQVIA